MTPGAPAYQAPYRLTIAADLWVWSDAHANEVVSQLVEKIAALRTEAGGGVTTHHKLTGWSIEKNRA